MSYEDRNRCYEWFEWFNTLVVVSLFKSFQEYRLEDAKAISEASSRRTTIYTIATRSCSNHFKGRK